MSKDRRDWSKFWDRISTGIPAIIALLLFIDPKSSAAQWIPEWIRKMTTENVQNALIVIIAVAVYIGLSRLRSIRDSLSPSATTSATVQVVSHGADGTVSVRLGEREFDFGPGAYDYYDRQNETGKEKIIRQLRRAKYLRWNKDEFEMLIDEKRRVQIRLDQFLGAAHDIKQEIDLEKVRRERESQNRTEEQERHPNAVRIVFAPAFDLKMQYLSTCVSNWQQEVYEFLQTEVKGHAEEFRQDVSHTPATMDQIQLLRHIVEVHEERILGIKRVV